MHISQDTTIQSMARILSEMLKKMDGFLQRDLERGQPQLEKDQQRPVYCEIPNDSAFPYCKAEWMCAHWQSDPCYSFYGVDGSTCSILIYLSEMEHFCPMLVWSNSTAGSARPKGEEKPVVSEPP
uniref:alpha-1,6-mannosyl-glycoprotein 6-beta-N-acetylglucosaminyltransferase n=1 Tax=Callorhinchus milii TaxID=7868 RepID=A0A4W3HJX4_CALMI